jgi:hypothetical protein
MGSTTPCGAFTTVSSIVTPRWIVNYQSDAGADTSAAVYGDNYGRLQLVKAAYDPQNVFHMNHNIAVEPSSTQSSSRSRWSVVARQKGRSLTLFHAFHDFPGWAAARVRKLDSAVGLPRTISFSRLLACR